MQTTLLITGILALAGAWVGPLPDLASGAFYAHMTMHMIVVAIAAPLIALGIAGKRVDPVRRWPRLFAPVPLSLIELLVVWAWHAPAWHHLARHTTFGLVLEQGTFLIAGLLVWLSAFGGGGRPDGSRSGAGVVALLLTSMHMTLLGALLALTPRPLYAHAGMTTELTPLADQQLGGAIMIVAGGVAYLAGGLWLVAGLLRTKSASSAPGESGNGIPAPALVDEPKGRSLSRVSDGGETS
jgi:putative membrane protein